MVGLGLIFSVLFLICLFRFFVIGGQYFMSIVTDDTLQRMLGTGFDIFSFNVPTVIWYFLDRDGKRKKTL